MKKGWIIALSVIGVVIITIIILCFTLFTVQSVKIQFWTSTAEEYDEQQIIESSQIKTGKNIFFLNKNAFSDNIEKAFPFLKVINIETSFPSTLTIHLSERQSFYSLQNDGQTILLDSELKVLSTQASALPAIEVKSEIIKLDGSQEKLQLGENIQPGQFLQIDLLQSFYDAILLNGLSREDGIGMIKSVQFFESENQVFGNAELGLKMTLNSGREVFLHNANYALAYKLAKFFAVEKALPSLAPNLSDEVLNGSEIHINNYIGSDYSQEESYFYLVYQGQIVTK